MGIGKITRFTFALILLLLLCRSFPRLLHPDIWAEDGSPFLQDALQVGWRSLWKPLAGSFYIPQRAFFVALIQAFPFWIIPYVASLTGLLLMAHVFSLFAQARYRWLVDSDRARFLVCAGLCGLPGLNEMVGNIANLVWVIFLWLALVGLRDWNVAAKKFEWAGILLGVCSIAVFPLLIPLFALRYGYQKKLLAARVGVPISLLLLVGATGLLVCVRPPGTDAGVSLDQFGAIVIRYLNHVSGFGILRPWLGDKLTLTFSQVDVPHWRVAWSVLSGVGTGYLIWRSWKGRGQIATAAVLVLAIGTSFWTVLNWLSRSYAFEVFALPINYMLFHGRYGFPVSAVFLLLWAALIWQAKTTERNRVLLIGWLACTGFLLGFNRMPIVPFGDEPRWKLYSPVLEKSYRTGCPKDSIVPIYPDGWHIEFRSPKTCAPSQP